MFKNRLFWHLNMIAALGGWLLIFYGLFFPLADGALHTAWWVVLLAWTIGHPLEMIFALPIAKGAGVSPGRGLLMTMVFGITWWLPLKLNVIDR